jgi:hypothetical protein
MSMLINCLKNRAVKCIATAELVEGRTVLEVTYIAGTYGMGGPSFFGLRLDKASRRAKEWLLCTLWGADNWMLVNGRWLGAHPDQYEQQRPLHGAAWKRTEQGYSVPTGEQWDEFQPMVLRQTITRFWCSERACQLDIGPATIVITEAPSTRTISFGSQEPRQLMPGDELRNAWILARTPGIRI